MSDTAFTLARRIMREELHKDPETFHSYQANVAVLLMDRYNKVNFQEYEWRNRAAKEILELIFDIKPTRIHYSTIVNEDPEFEQSGTKKI